MAITFLQAVQQTSFLIHDGLEAGLAFYPLNLKLAVRSSMIFLCSTGTKKNEESCCINQGLKSKRPLGPRRVLLPVLEIKKHWP